MRAVLIINILFLMFYGNLMASGGDLVPHCIENIHVNVERVSSKNFFINYSDLAPDYSLIVKNPDADNMPENHDPAANFLHHGYVSDYSQTSRNYVPDYSLIRNNNILNSLLINHNHIPENFLSDLKTGLETDLFSRPDRFTGFLQKDNSSDTGNKSPSLKKPAVKNIIPAIAGLVYVSFIFDEQVNAFARDNQTSFLKTVAHYTDIGGEKKVVVPGILLTYGTARFLLKNEKLQTTSLNAIQSVIVTGIVTESVKNLAGRARPFTNEGAYTLNPFPGSKDQYKSLPSGHSSLAFSLFTPFAETYSRWIYLVPVSVAAGRVYQDKHWLSDVVTGGGIGLVSGLLFTHYENITIIPNGLRIYF